MNVLVFTSALVLGLASSLHCIGMCGPLMMAIPFCEQKNGWWQTFLYFLAKAIAYGILGAVAGLVGLPFIWGPSQQILSILAGVLVLLMVVLPLIKKSNVKFPFQKLFNELFSRMRTKPRWWHFFSLGFLNGWLPCGMVYIAMATALASGNPLEGFIAMICFGLGTIPALFILSRFKTKLNAKWRNRLKPLSITITIVVAGLLILRGMDLGIPYISPKLEQEKEVKMNCCSTPKDESKR